MNDHFPFLSRSWLIYHALFLGVDSKENDPKTLAHGSDMMTARYTSQSQLYRSTSVPGRLPDEDLPNVSRLAPWDNPHQK